MEKQLIFFTAINISQENDFKILLILLTIVLKTSNDQRGKVREERVKKNNKE